MLIVKLAILERVFCPQKMVASTAFATRFGGSVYPEMPWSICPETVGQLAPKWCGLIHHNLHISHGFLQSLRDSGVLPFTKIGGSIYYDYDDITFMMSTNKSA
jgi:hypothetical protein